MTERERNEVCKGYADLIIRKEQLSIVTGKQNLRSEKYITKRDESNPEFDGKIFTSKRIGIGYINKTHSEDTNTKTDSRKKRIGRNPE